MNIYLHTCNIEKNIFLIYFQYSIFREEEALNGEAIIAAAEETLQMEDFQICNSDFKTELL